jgi:hypothetical protein
MFCFDTDVLSAVVGKAPSLPLMKVENWLST